jgi:hypothetical protein
MVHLTRVRPVCPQRLGPLGVSLALPAPVWCGLSSLSRDDHQRIDSGDFDRYILN